MRSCAIALWVLAFLLAAACFPTVTRAQEVTVTSTMYSCEWHIDNKMATTPGMCEITRFGRDPATVGVACPYEWQGWWLWVEGVGVRLCDDASSLSDTTFRGHPHLDIRVSSFEEARAYGVQQIQVRRVYYSYRERINMSAKEGRGPY